MSADGQRTKRRRNIAENFNRPSRVQWCTNVTDRRQTDGRRHIANVNVYNGSTTPGDVHHCSVRLFFCSRLNGTIECTGLLYSGLGRWIRLIQTAIYWEDDLERFYWYREFLYRDVERRHYTVHTRLRSCKVSKTRRATDIIKYFSNKVMHRWNMPNQLITDDRSKSAGWKDWKPDGFLMDRSAELGLSGRAFCKWDCALQAYYTAHTTEN